MSKHSLQGARVVEGYSPKTFTKFTNLCRSQVVGKSCGSKCVNFTPSLHVLSFITVPQRARYPQWRLALRASGARDLLQRARGRGKSPRNDPRSEPCSCRLPRLRSKHWRSCKYFCSAVCPAPNSQRQEQLDEPFNKFEKQEMQLLGRGDRLLQSPCLT